jgi:hypothetical protein
MHSKRPSGRRIACAAARRMTADTAGFGKDERAAECDTVPAPDRKKTDAAWLFKRDRDA